MFFIFLTIGTFINEFFEISEQEEIKLGQYRKVFRQSDLDSIKSFSLINKFGTFRFTRKVSRARSLWTMISPRKLPTDNVVINDIFSTLRDIQIRDIYSYDNINADNYHLDSPLVEIRSYDIQGHANTIKFGLVNSIDQSTYIYISRRNVIYNVDIFDHKMDSLEITDFIDARIFALTPEIVEELKIYKGTNNNIPLMHLKKKHGRWFDGQEKQLNTQKVSNYLKEFMAIKSPLILDKTSEELQKKIDVLFSRPLFVVEIKDNIGTHFSYNISSIMETFPNLKTEGKQNFIVKANNREFPYIMDKKFFKYFSKKKIN